MRASDMAGRSPPRGAPVAWTPPLSCYVGNMQANEIENLMESTYDNHHESIMRILIKDSENCVLATSTGFVVYTEANKNLVMTCEHNLPRKEKTWEHCFTDSSPGNGNFVVRLSGRSEEFPLNVEYRDTVHDLLLFSVSDVSCPSLKLFDDDVLPGRPVILFGYLSPDLDLKKGDTWERIIAALVKDPSVIPGNIIGEPYLDTDYSEFHEVITYDSPVFTGSSGSPVIMNDKVIGVHYRNIGNFREACSINTVKFVLRKWLGVTHDDDQDTSDDETLAKLTIDDMLAKLAAKIREQ